MINQILKTQEISWIMNRSKMEVPYSDEDYTEFSFSGSLPWQMANKIKATRKALMNNQESIIEQNDNFEHSLTIKFGRNKRNNNTIIFFYTLEKL